MRCYRTGLVFIIGAALVCAPAAAQNFEVRTFLGDPADSDATYQYLYNSVRQQWVCPYCAFSRDTQVFDGSANCPNPWGIAGHPTVALVNLASLPRERFLALATPTMPDEDHSDLRLTRENPAAPPVAELLYRALLGRPYKPTDSDGRTVRSTLYAAAAGLINNDNTVGPVIANGGRVRWLVIPPTPLRREFKTTDAPGLSYALGARHPRAQADPGADNGLGGDNDWRPQVLARDPAGATIIAPEEMGDFLEIGVNPYRVDEGDYWWVRYREIAQDVQPGPNVQIVTRRAQVEVYSVLYGRAIETLDINPAGGVVEFPFSVIVDSGALRLTFLANVDPDLSGWSDADSGGGWHTWTVGFMVRSNCRLLPGWQDLYDAAADPRFKDLNGNWVGNAGFDLINDPFPGPKQCWMEATNSTPNFTTASDVEQTGNPPAPYVFPANATGDGLVAVEWSGDTVSGWSPDPTANNAAGTVYYRTGVEWQYDAGIGPGGTVTSITNAKAAAPTAGGSASYNTTTYPYIHLAAARFMVTRPEIPPTGTQWDKDADGTGDEDAETQALPLAYPKVIIGQRNGALVHGAYGAGSVTARRTYDVLNRWNGEGQTRACRTCGALWPPGTTAPDQCPYHGIVAQDIQVVHAVGASDASYNGDYTKAAGTQNGRPYFQMGVDRFVYWGGNRWLMSDSLTDTVGQAVYRGTGYDLPANPWYPKKKKTSVGPTVTIDTVPNVAELAPQGAGAFAAAQTTWRQATAVTLDERLAAPVVRKQVLPETAFKSTARVVAPLRNAGTAGSEDLWAEIPRYQPPSVPGVGMTNDYDNDFGYRGGQALYRNEEAPNNNAGLTAGWDTFYRNPDNGYFQPQAGVWPYVYPSGQIVWATSPPAGTTEVPGRHYFCPVCGIQWGTDPADPGVCRFDGATVIRIPTDKAVRQEHLVAEEFEPYEVQVSVNRTGGLAQSQSNIEVGRTAPGVNSQRPDTTVQPLAAHRAFPADVSLLPAWPYRPSDAKVLLRNEGNIGLSLRLGNTYDFDETQILDRSLDHYLRVEVDPLSLSYGRKAQSGPVTRDTFMPRVSVATPALPYEGSLTNSALWSFTAPNAEAGQFAGNAGEGFVTAGTYTGRPTAKPVPLGQPVGTYSGQHLQYVDVNSNGVFDFAYWNGSTYVDTDSASCPRPFNPSIDMPQEPLAGVLGGQMRVFETRLPQSDYYARDSDPVVLPSPTPGVMQVIWSTNRISADPDAAGYNGSTAPAGTDPTALPTSTTPLNLVYVTTAGVTGGADDPLYRDYLWPTSGGAIAPASILTTDRAGTVNSAPWVTYSADGSAKWAFWHRSLRYVRPDATGTAGVESTLRFRGPLAAGSWNWGAAAAGWIYDTGQPKQGLRGFPQPGGMWLFWHEGTPGRERIMYRWDFTGAANSNEAMVPVANVAGAGLTDLVSAVYWDGATWQPATIRRAGLSPFTYTRDVSVFVYNGLVNVFFSGFVTHEGQADICWTRFNLASMGPTSAADNFAKRPFPTLTEYEELQPSGWHQMFSSRHLDWMVAGSTTASAVYTPAFRPRDGINPGDGYSPALRLQLAYHDTIGDGLPRPQQTFQIMWEDNRNNYYDRARSVHRVTPILVPIGGSSLPSPWGIPVTSGPYAGGFMLRDPHSSASNSRPVTMDINPAAGTIVFSAPLFNEDAPGDPTAVLTNAPGLNYNGATLEDVVVQAIYTPYVYRVTRSGAADDSPSAFYDPTAASRLTVFWRRSFAASESPHFGRPAFMYKAFTTSIQVGRPPVTGTPTITDLTVGGAVTPTASDATAGLYTVDASRIGHYLQVTYDGAGGTYTERHQVIGWSQEMVVPVDTVVGEGAFVAVPEAYSVPSVEGGAANIPAVRYWLFWASPRGVYDLRLVEDANGTRYQPTGANPHDLPIHPSSDIYMAVVAPEFGSLAPERAVPTVVPGGT